MKISELSNTLYRRGCQNEQCQVDADRTTLWYGLLDRTLGLDRYEPFAARTRYGDDLQRAEDVPAIAVPEPAQLRQEHPVIALVKFERRGFPR